MYGTDAEEKLFPSKLLENKLQSFGIYGTITVKPGERKKTDMAKRSFEGAVIMAPLPCVMVSSGTLEKPNVMTVAWTGIVNTHPAKTYISVRKSRYSYELITKSREFVINLVPSTLVRACDFCGVRSGRTIDKFKACSLTPEASEAVSAPAIAECPLQLECRVSEIIPLGTHDMILADIVKMRVSEDIIDDCGKFRLDKAGLLAYMHGNYYTLGKKIGSFGYSVKKKKKPAAAQRQKKSGKN